MPLDIFNTSKYLNFLLKRLHLYIIAFSAVFLILSTSLCAYFGYKLCKFANKDYIFFSDGYETKSAKRRNSSSLFRNETDIAIFSEFLIQRLFANSEYTFERSFNQIFEYMDEVSAKVTLSLINEDIMIMYKVHNAISDVHIKNIKMNITNSPAEVSINFGVNVRFPKKEAVLKDQYTESVISFQVIPVTRSLKNPHGIQIRNVQFSKI